MNKRNRLTTVFTNLWLQRRLVGMLALPLIFGMCFYGAYYSYRKADNAVYSSYLSSVGRALGSNIFLTSEEDLFEALEAGLRQKDPYFKMFRRNSDFESAFSSFTSQLTAKYGIRFEAKTGLIKMVMKHSASASILQPNDILINVNGETDPTKFLKAFQRASDSKISFTRNTKLLEATLSPSIIEPAYCKFKNGVARITLYFFRPEILPIIRDFFEHHQADITKIVFDLTQCPGGQVQTLSALLSNFLPADSSTFVVKGRTDSKVFVTAFSPIYDLTKHIHTKLEFLKSSSTASCAEIFIGVLSSRFAARTELTGPTTYGKWTIIQPIKFLKGGIVSSVGSVYLMNGKTYEGVGL